MTYNKAESISVNVDFILSHFRNRVFPRTISTFKTRGSKDFQLTEKYSHHNLKRPADDIQDHPFRNDSVIGTDGIRLNHIIFDNVTFQSFSIFYPSMKARKGSNRRHNYLFV